MKFPAIPVLLLLMSGHAMAVPVKLRSVQSPAGGVPGFPVTALVDEQVVPGEGWKPEPSFLSSDLAAVVIPQSPVSSKVLLMQLFFPGPEADAYFGRFGIDVTTDATPLPEGRWMPLILEASGSLDPTVPPSAMPVVHLEPRQAPFSLTFRARAPFDGITGFRLRIFAEENPSGTFRAGRGREGAFLLGEFRVETDAPQSSNMALGRQVYCSRQVQEGLPSRNLTDGFHATWCQPGRNAADPDAFFQMDLGQTTRLNHLVIRWRQNPERPVVPDRYQVELLSESGGFDGKVTWLAERRGERSRAAEVLQAADGTGEFSGRSLMVQVKGGPGDQPQISEIEVYPALHAQARQWMADGRSLEANGRIEVPPGTSMLSFMPVCAAPREGVGECRWKLSGWKEEWQESLLGTTVMVDPVPPPGEYTLVLQARHTDLVWDTSGMPVVFRTAAPWWKHLPSALAAGSAVLLAGGAGGWWWFARRLRRRLARTEHHLELHRDRLRISRDMHDEIGARLTSIALLAERTQRPDEDQPRLLDTLARQARTTVEALDTIVWAVNPRHDTAGGLADYLSDYAPAYLEAAGIECLMDFRIAGPSRPLPLAVRHNLLMAAKEALRNVVKHAGANLCRLVLTDSGNRLDLTVSDDGRGMKTPPPAGISHTGMESMRQRLTEAGGHCAFHPGPDGHGTEVHLSVPLDQAPVLPALP